MGLFDNLPDTPNKHEFARTVLERIRQAGSPVAVLYDPSGFRLHTAEPRGPQLFLENGYREYCNAPAELREQHLRRLVRGWGLARPTIPEEFEDVKPDLLPVVRPRAYFELTRLRIQLEGGPAPNWPYQTLGDHLAAALVYDLPDAMQSVDQANLDAWGVSFYEAMEVARENLAQMPCNFLGPEHGEGLYVSACGDNYDASRLLSLDAIRQMRVKGDPVAMAPNRDTLLVAGSDDAEALGAMLAMATGVLQKPRPLSGVALRLDGDDWVSWLPEPSQACHGEFRSLFTQWTGQDYQEQKEILDKLRAKTGGGLSVASYSAIEDPKTKTLLTLCIWGKHLVSLLPRTDLVALMAPGRESTIVPWARVCEVVGDMMQLQEMYPERYLVTDFPTDEQLAAMAAAAL